MSVRPKTPQGCKVRRGKIRGLWKLHVSLYGQLPSVDVDKRYITMGAPAARPTSKSHRHTDSQLGA